MLRDAAGLFVAYGRILGHADAVERASGALGGTLELSRLRREAARARAQAEALMRRIESSPLERFARALVAARAAWRGVAPAAPVAYRSVFQPGGSGGEKTEAQWQDEEHKKKSEQ